MGANCTAAPMGTACVSLDNGCKNNCPCRNSTEIDMKQATTEYLGKCDNDTSNKVYPGARCSDTPTKPGEIDCESPNYFLRDLPELERSRLNAKENLGHHEATYTFKSGATYKGQWHGWTRHGFGQQMWTDGTSYKGEWSQNMAEGKGCFLHANGDCYIGQWASSKAQGHGKYYTSHATYSGEWHNDLLEGCGVEELDSGASYRGGFRKGTKSGSGVYRWPDGSIYHGSWEDNEVNGIGKFVGSDGRSFEGCWRDSVAHGTGKYTWSDGRSYSGQYAFDKKHGFGVFRWPEKLKYEGFWKEGKQSGIGVYTGEEGMTSSQPRRASEESQRAAIRPPPSAMRTEVLAVPIGPPQTAPASPPAATTCEGKA